jgi:hypothetical protein
MEHEIHVVCTGDLNDTRVAERLLQKRTMLAQVRGTARGPTVKTPLIHRSWFNLLVAGLVAGFLAWAIVEPYFDDETTDETRQVVQGFLFFSTVGGLAGLLIGTMDGLLARNYRRAARGASFGVLFGFVGGLVSTWASGVAILISASIVRMFGGTWDDPAHSFPAFFAIVVVRGIAWTVAGMAVGLGPGIALKSRELARNGFLGGMIGALIGGVLFDPINYFVSGGTFERGVEISRMVGMTVVAGGAGLMIGFVETVTKRAWLLMVEGPLKGKEFVLYKDITVLGSSPRSEVYLYKDPGIRPTHARIERIRDGYEVIAEDAQTGIMVNGVSLHRKRLSTGDEIQLGKVRFVYSGKQ